MNDHLSTTAAIEVLVAIFVIMAVAIAINAGVIRQAIQSII